MIATVGRPLAAADTILIYNIGGLAARMSGERATPHRDLFAPKQTFSRNTSLKKRGRRQPYRAFSSCLAEKLLAKAR